MPSKSPVTREPELPEITDEPISIAERFQRARQGALNTPPKHRTKPTPTTPKSKPSTKKTQE